MKKHLLLFIALTTAIIANAAAPALYYLVGLDNNWTPQEKFQLTRNVAAQTNDGIDEFYIDVELKTTDQFKIVETQEDQVTVKTWFPDNKPNYGEYGEITEAGKYTVYFRPNADGKDNWYYKVIYVDKKQETAISTVESDIQSTKIFRNGTMYILRNGVYYNVNGATVQ